VAVYEVRILPTARRELAALPTRDRKRADAAILTLAENPRPPRCKKIAGEEDLYRIRIGVWRVLYRIKDELLLVVVVRVRHRSDAYRRPFPSAAVESGPS